MHKLIRGVDLHHCHPSTLSAILGLARVHNTTPPYIRQIWVAGSRRRGEDLLVGIDGRSRNPFTQVKIRERNKTNALISSLRRTLMARSVGGEGGCAIRVAAGSSPRLQERGAYRDKSKSKWIEAKLFCCCFLVMCHRSYCARKTSKQSSLSGCEMPVWLIATCLGRMFILTGIHKNFSSTLNQQKLQKVVRQV